MRNRQAAKLALNIENRVSQSESQVCVDKAISDSCELQ
jgi:hypothetical protein